MASSTRMTETRWVACVAVVQKVTFVTAAADGTLSATTAIVMAATSDRDFLTLTSRFPAVSGGREGSW